MVKLKTLSLLTLDRWLRSEYTTRREQTIKSSKEGGINRTATHIDAHNVAKRFFEHLFGIIIPQINHVLGLNIAFYCPLTVAGDETLSGDNSSEQSGEESSTKGNTTEHENESEAVASGALEDASANSSGNDGYDRGGVALRSSKRRRIENDREVDQRTPVSIEGDGMQIVSPTHLGISRRFLTAFPY